PTLSFNGLLKNSFLHSLANARELDFIGWVAILGYKNEPVVRICCKSRARWALKSCKINF
ncbi:hypothetical protein NF867_02345, partial [Solitalea sp. MAHUQ-68]|nr:hypothetical protein [Solitalea agri]